MDTEFEESQHLHKAERRVDAGKKISHRSRPKTSSIAGTPNSLSKSGHNCNPSTKYNISGTHYIVPVTYIQYVIEFRYFHLYFAAYEIVYQHYLTDIPRIGSCTWFRVCDIFSAVKVVAECNNYDYPW